MPYLLHITCTLVLKVLWECGGTLAAPAIAGAVIHKALAFIAPKLVRPRDVLDDYFWLEVEVCVQTV